MIDILSALKELVYKYSSEPTPALVMKKVNDEEQRIIGVVLEPDVYDLHNDIYSAEEVAKACSNFNTHCMQANVQHMVNVDDGAATIEKSFILEVDASIGGQFVKAGSWVQQWKINSDDIWSAVKAGTFTGFSIGGMAKFEDIN